jgi:MFS family permease
MVKSLVAEVASTTREITPNARLFLLATLLSWVGLSVNQVVFNLYLVAAGYEADFVGAVTSMMGLGMAATALPAGWMADRFGRRACLLGGSVVIATALLARSLSLSPGALFASTLLLGAGQAVVTIAASPFMIENSEEFERTHLFSMHFVVVLLGGLLGNLMGGELPGLFENQLPDTLVPSPLIAYRYALVAGALASVLAAWPLLSVREAPAHERPAVEPARARDHAGLLSRLGLYYLVVGFGAGLIMPFFNLYFSQRYAANAGQIGLYFSVAQVLTLAATLTGPLLARRMGKLQAVTVLQLLSLPFLVTLGVETTLAVSVAAFWLRSVFMQMSSPLVTSFAMELIPAALRARAQAIDNMCWYVGWAMSSLISGQIMARFGFEWPYYLTALCYGVLTILFWWFFRAPQPARAQAGRSTPPGAD